MELLLKKDNIKKETDICNQHAANADKDSEYEVEEQKMEKVQLAVGTYVTTLTLFPMIQANMGALPCVGTLVPCAQRSATGPNMSTMSTELSIRFKKLRRHI